MKLIKGDCLEELKKIEDGSVDMILTDLPYGTTNCKWDAIIPFEDLWNEYNRIIKPNGVVALFGCEPFSSHLRLSNIENYRYDWTWVKNRGTGHLNAKKQPLRQTENISIFYKKQCNYNPQGTTSGVFNNNRPWRKNGKSKESIYNKESEVKTTTTGNYPKNVLNYPNVNNKGYHPTQKPVALLEYLIRTYTNEGETVLDSTMGSGSTGVAAVNTGRDFIGIELDENYFEIAKNRIKEAEEGLKYENRN